MQRGKAVVIGNFVDTEHHVWSPRAKAFDTVKAAVGYLESKAVLNEDEFMSRQSGFVDETTLSDEDKGIDMLIDVVRGNPNIAIKTFRSRHEANSFVSLIKQMAQKRANRVAKGIAMAS